MSLDNLATAQTKFATHKVHRLDPICAFVNRGNSRVAVILRNSGLFNESHATVNLHCEAREFNTHVGAPTF